MSPTRRQVTEAALEDSEPDREVPALRCDQCGRRIRGAPASRGLFLWARGEEVRYEEPPLCERCASPARYGLPDEGLEE